MEEGLLAGDDLDRDAELGRHRLEHALDRVEVRRHRLPVPATGAERAHRERRDAPGLEGRRRPVAGELAGEHAVVRR